MPLAVVAAVATAAGGIAKGVIGSNAAKSAAKTQAAAADRAGALVDARFQQTRGDLEPYRAAGQGGVDRLNAMSQPGFQFNPTDPSYAFRFNEGTRAVNTSAAARGNRLSGGTLRALTRYGQGAASQEYGAEFGRNLNVAQMGQSAAAQTGAFGAQAAGQQAGLITDAARATAAGKIGAANAWGGAIDTASDAFGNYASGMGGAGGGGGASGYLANNPQTLSSAFQTARDTPVANFSAPALTPTYYNFGR